MRIRRLVFAVLIAFAGVAVAVPTVVLGATSAGSVTARVLIPKRRLTAGSEMKATVEVRNTTGQAVSVVGCGSIFQVALTSKKVTPMVGWLACAQTITIPTGTSKFPVMVSGKYSSCGEGIPGPACLGPGQVPPLPPGRYGAHLYQNPTVAATPRPIRIVVTSAKT